MPMTTEFRALSIGDTHIEEGARFDECVRVLDAFADLVEREKPHAVFHSGDVFERGSTPEEREYAASLLQRCANTAPTFVVKGNHDRWTDLLILARLKAHHKITVCETCCVAQVGFDGQRAQIGMMAWPTRASALDEEGSKQAVRQVLADLGNRMDRLPGPRVLLGHFDISGAKVGAKGQPLIGGALTVTLADLALARAHVTVAGHIHKAQDWEYDGHPVIYGGSPFRTDAGETEAKSFLSLSMTEEGRVTWLRVPSPAREWHLLEGVWARLTSGEAGWAEMPTDPERLRGADVRFRYSRTPEEQDASDRAASALRDRWLAEGAATVDLDKVLLASTRARVPEISTAATLEDKIDVLWTSQGRIPDAPVRARLFGRLGALDAFGTKWQSPSVRYRRIRAKGLGFKSEIDLDLDAIPGPLVAITGENGCGKTVLMEMFAGVLDRTLPTRGSLVELAKLTGDRSAYLEADLVNGQAWTVRHDIDGVSGKSEASMRDADGVEALPDRKVSSFDKMSARTFPPPEVRMASTMRAQKSLGFLALTPADRRGIVLRAIGVEALEAMASQSRGFASTAKVDLDSIDARLGDERRRVGTATVESAEDALSLATTSHAEAANALLVAQGYLGEVRAEAARVTEANADRERRAAALMAAALLVTNAKAEVETLEARLVTSRQALEGLEEARAASLRCEGLRADIATHTIAIAALPFAELRAKKDAALKAAEAARRQVASIKAALTQAEAQAAALQALRVECASLDGADARFDEATKRVHALRLKLDEATAMQLGAATHRIVDLRSHLSGIRDRKWDDPSQAAVHGLLQDDDAADAQRERPAEIDRLTEIHAKQCAESVRLGTDNMRLIQARSRLDALSKEPNRHSELSTELASLNSAIARHDEEALDASLAMTEAGQTRTHADAAIEQATLELQSLSPLVDRLSGAASAETRVAVDEEALIRAQASLAELRSRLDEAALGPIPEAQPLPNVLAAEGAERSAQGILGDAKVAVALRERELSDVLAAAARISELENKRAIADVDCSDWSRLAGDLGKDGLQNLAVDSAAPQLTELTNMLLRECVGSRWAVQIETQRASADGKKTLEGFEVRVFDSEEGRDVLGDRLSGGQMCIVDEAISLAITMYASGSGSGATLNRDETGAALDPMHGKAYVLMLRRAAAYVGAGRVLFVSHNKEMADMADSRIEMDHGHLRLLPA